MMTLRDLRRRIYLQHRQTIVQRRKQETDYHSYTDLATTWSTIILTRLATYPPHSIMNGHDAPSVDGDRERRMDGTRTLPNPRWESEKGTSSDFLTGTESIDSLQAALP